MRRKWLPLLALAVISAGFAGCADKEAGGTLTVYSGRSEELVGPLIERFEEESGVEVEVRYADSGELALLIEEEGDKSPADVFYSQSPGPLDYLANKDLLGDIGSRDIEFRDVGFKDPEGKWIGTSARVRVLVYNTELIDEADLPDSVLGLTDPEYKGKVAVAPDNGSFQDFVSALRAQEGDEAAEKWLEDMAANDAKSYADNGAIVEAVSRGEVPMGLVNHYYNLIHQEENPDATTENHYFEEGDAGSMMLVSGAGILESTDSREDADEFVDFLLTEESQKYFTGDDFEYPVVEGVPLADGVPPLDEITVARIDFANLDDLKRTKEMIDSSGL